MKNDFTELVDLATTRFGGEALLASDEFFAPKENLLKPGSAVFIPDRYTDNGKWMDGWETRRRRPPGPGPDWCIVALGLPGSIHGVDVDTAHFKGNFPESCSIEAIEAGPHADAPILARAGSWREILPRTPLKGDSSNLIPITESWRRSRFTHLRLNIFPDGGVARLRVYGLVMPEWKRILAAAGGDPVDLALVSHGGMVLSCSDMFFGPRHNLIQPGPSTCMSDGWETRRRRGPGHDWCIVRLGRRGPVSRFEVDTSHFKGNFPDSCTLEGCDAREVGELHPPADTAWTPLLPRTPLRPHTRHVFTEGLATGAAMTHVRLNIFPDGGVARLRVFGRPEGA
jgi:allantoicase